nr:PREDICTED: beta-sarcoglycan [Lepisosteus oculatus]
MEEEEGICRRLPDSTIPGSAVRVRSRFKLGLWVFPNISRVPRIPDQPAGVGVGRAVGCPARRPGQGAGGLARVGPSCHSAERRRPGGVMASEQVGCLWVSLGARGHALSCALQVVFQQGTTTLSVDKDKTSITSDVGMSFVDPRSHSTFFSTDFDNHEFHLPKGVKVLSVRKASTERITSNASSDLTIRVDGKAIVRGNEGVFIMGKTVEFRMGGDIELKAENSIVLNGSVMVSPSRIPNSSASGELLFDEGLERYKLCMCADGTLFRVQVKNQNMGCQTSDNPCGAAH